MAPNVINALHGVETIGFSLNTTKNLIDEISINKPLIYNQDDVYWEGKREVGLHVYESSFLEYFTQLCSNKISVMHFNVYLPITCQGEFVRHLKSLLKNKYIHVRFVIKKFYT